MRVLSDPYWKRPFQPPAPEDELSLEEAKWRAVGRYTPRGLGYSPEDMWQKTDYLDLNATGTFTSYMEAGGLMIGRNEKYVSGTWEVVSAKEDRITLRAKYNEEQRGGIHPQGNFVDCTWQGTQLAYRGCRLQLRKGLIFSRQCNPAFPFTFPHAILPDPEICSHRHLGLA